MSNVQLVEVDSATWTFACFFRYPVQKPYRRYVGVFVRFEPASLSHPRTLFDSDTLTVLRFAIPSEALIA